MKKFLVFIFVILLLMVTSSILYANFFTDFLDSARAGNTKRVQKLLVDNKDKLTRIKALNYALYNNHTDTAALLLNYVKPNDYTAINGLESPILISSITGNNTITKKLVDNGSITKDALQAAISFGNYETAKILLNNGADPNTSFQSYPWSKPAPQVISLLTLMIDKGADVKGNFGLTALSAATELKTYDFINTLLEKGASVHLSKALVTAVKVGDKEMAAYLLNKGATVERNALLYALMSNRTDLFEYLLNRSAPIQINDIKTSSLLTVAVNLNNSEAINLMLGKGIDLNIVPEHGVSPLITAVQNLNPEIVKLLLENGASTRITDQMGRSPVEIIQSKRKNELDWFDIGHKEDCRKILDLLKKYDKK